MCSFHARVLYMEGRKRKRNIGAVTRGGGDASVFDSSQMEPDTEFPGRRAGPTSMEELGVCGTRAVASGRCGFGHLEHEWWQLLTPNNWGSICRRLASSAPIKRLTSTQANNIL